MQRNYLTIIVENFIFRILVKIYFHYSNFIFQTENHLRTVEV